MMEVILDNAYKLYNFYNWCLSRADKRVSTWPLMHSCMPTVVLTASYLFIVKIGKEIMEHRTAFRVRYSLFVYNLGLIVLNFYIFFELFTASWKLGYSYTCQPVNFTDNPDEMRIAKAIWWFYFSKLIEMLDTVFFILRKKNNQITFLHIYHHASMFPIWWIGVKWVAGGQSFFGAMMNSFMHVVMYSYYALSSLGPWYQKFLWWKKYLTRLQLVQFVLGISHAMSSLYIGCDFPVWMQWALIFYGLSILVFFLNFYLNAYIKPAPKFPKMKSDIYCNGDVHREKFKMH